MKFRRVAILPHDPGRHQARARLPACRERLDLRIPPARARVAARDPVPELGERVLGLVRDGCIREIVCHLAVGQRAAEPRLVPEKESDEDQQKRHECDDQFSAVHFRSRPRRSNEGKRISRKGAVRQAHDPERSRRPGTQRNAGNGGVTPASEDSRMRSFLIENLKRRKAEALKSGGCRRRRGWCPPPGYPRAIRRGERGRAPRLFESALPNANTARTSACRGAWWRRLRIRALLDG